MSALFAVIYDFGLVVTSIEMTGENKIAKKESDIESTERTGGKTEEGEEEEEGRRKSKVWLKSNGQCEKRDARFGCENEKPKIESSRKWKENENDRQCTSGCFRISQSEMRKPLRRMHSRFWAKILRSGDNNNNVDQNASQHARREDG